MQFEIREFLEELKSRGLAPGTLENYRIDLEQLSEFVGDKPFNYDVMQNYKSYLYTKYKAATVYKKIVIANKFWRKITGKPSPIKLDKLQNHSLNYMTTGDFKKFISCLKRHKENELLMLVSVIAHFGLRISEVLSLRVCDFDDDIQMLSIKCKGTVRDVPISTQMRKDIKAYIKSKKLKGDSVVFNYSREYIHSQLKKYAGLAKINKKKVHAHAFRHLFANIYMTSVPNANVIHLADMLGHKSLETTRIYTKKSIHQQRETMDAIGGFLKGRKK